MMREWSDKAQGENRAILVEAAVLGVLQVLAVAGLAMMIFAPQPVDAHPGGLAADGCHNDRKNGGRHCHGSAPPKRTGKAARTGTVTYRNCAEARAAGAAPVRRGDPGYAPHLDRDNDGIGCE